MKKKIVFTGGGSAGHVSVNAAIIPEFIENSWDVTYIGSEQGIEKSIIEKEFPQISYRTVAVGKLRRYLSLQNLKDPFKVIKGIFDARRILKEVRPEFIFSKGGFVSVPVVLAGKMLKIPILIHESDYTPGLANKIAMPFASKIFTTFQETAANLPEQKAMYIGAVLRDGIFKGNAAKGKIFCGFDSSRPVLLVMGGSLGAVKINNLITENLDELLNSYQIIHICGKGNVKEHLKRKGYCPFEFVHEELFDLLAASDVIVSRAGSNSIFEFLGLQKPMLLIPLSAQASRGDQILNAASFEKQGFAKVLQEENATYQNFEAALHTLQEKTALYKDKMKKERPFKTAHEMYELLNGMMKNR
ncbi:undecaprenyldiphospho-muramoylpentapeptide beta-N-acetylglucosaminyltransferase [Peribacillus sp. B-H-3]|jgi:UDP-N-acetylglucosamine--N-acetylmuramyl-(pentapeptide) pyrophosphoryl-undecaprenol N-acetylglucosamine transferase|uniref:undecaprenyldiphospho-muramoylpentapeptide beta-N-acetylglucosaminyltransferase n=1 Tax=Peribacillus sp. B-H-3 TaxID=3400420 RepID=UPI003B01ADFF